MDEEPRLDIYGRPAKKSPSMELMDWMIEHGELTAFFAMVLLGVLIILTS